MRHTSTTEVVVNRRTRSLPGMEKYLRMIRARGMIPGLKKPVITIKPLAAGRLSLLVGLGFSWGTIRDIDMVCIGTSFADEPRARGSVSAADHPEVFEVHLSC